MEYTRIVYSANQKPIETTKIELSSQNSDADKHRNIAKISGQLEIGMFVQFVESTTGEVWTYRVFESGGKKCWVNAKIVKQAEDYE
jgi:hypothetical protein